MDDSQFGYKQKNPSIFWLHTENEVYDSGSFFLFFSHFWPLFFFFFPQICEVGGFNIHHAQEDLAKFG
jgi:hypothetical protein